MQRLHGHGGAASAGGRMLLSATTIGLLTVTASANLLVNGSFEVNTENTGVFDWFGDPADDWVTFADLFATATPDMWSNTGAAGNAPGHEQILYDATAFAGDKWTTIAGDPLGASFGFREGVESAPVNLAGGVDYILTLAMMFDDTNVYGRTNPAELTVRLRRGAEESTIIGTLAETAEGVVWETRQLIFAPAETGSYTIILSNEDLRPSYLSLDAVCLLSSCDADLNASLQIGFDDLILLLTAWGDCEGACEGDLNCDDQIGFDDLQVLLTAWGPCADT